jgi:hypothetical protein
MSNPGDENEFKEADATELENHHILSQSRNSPISFFPFVQTNPDDPAKKIHCGISSLTFPERLLVTQNFILKLQDHLLGRILSHDFDDDTHQLFSDRERNSIHIQNNTIYHLSTFRVNYTTYDLRQDFDTINSQNPSFCHGLITRDRA